MKPFLLLATRDDDQAAAAEYRSVLRHTGLPSDRLLRQIRVESGPMPPVNLSDYSGVLLGGSSFDISDPEKSDLQLRVESDLRTLVDQIVDRDFPFLGLCYGIGLVTHHIGGHVDNTYAEGVGAIRIHLTADGRADPLLDGISDTFDAFVGHKEGCTRTPPGAVLLATGHACPVQMYRVGANVYVTQFHPELDADDLAERMRIYQHAGYFRPEEMDDLIRMARASGVNGEQHLLLSNFVSRYAD